MEHKFDRVIMGFDPGTQKAGWCVGEGYDVLASGALDLGPAGGKNLWRRLTQLEYHVRQLLEVWQPTIVACEIPHPTRNAHTARALGISVGIIAGAAFYFHTDWIPVHNAQLRATGCHKRNLARAAMRAGKDSVTEDEADAIGAWKFAMRQAELDWEQEVLPLLSKQRFEQETAAQLAVNLEHGRRILRGDGYEL